MRRSDLRIVRDYVLNHSSGFSFGCYSSWTSEIFIDDKKIRISNSSRHTNEEEDQCPAAAHQKYKIWSEKLEECSANLSDLDDVVETSQWECGPPQCFAMRPFLEIKCLTGDCAYCRFRKRDRNSDWNTEDQQTHFMNVELGNPKYIKRKELNSFARALSRIISYGSDEALCKAHPS